MRIGRVAVVTGGASGIGFGLATRVRGRGHEARARRHRGARARRRGREAASAAGAEVIGVRTDVSDAAQVQALADATVERFGAIHVACNNAGVGAGGLSWEAPLDTWEWVLGVNLWGVIHGIRSFVPVMIAAARGAHREHRVDRRPRGRAVHGPVQREQARGRRALGDAAPRARADGAAREGVGAVPGVGADPDRRERAEPPGRRERGRGRTRGFAQVLQPLLDNGMPPEEVAATVLAAIRAEQFWVLPHDDAEEHWAPVRERPGPVAHRPHESHVPRPDRVARLTPLRRVARMLPRARRRPVRPAAAREVPGLRPPRGAGVRGRARARCAPRRRAARCPASRGRRRCSRTRAWRASWSRA